MKKGLLILILLPFLLGLGLGAAAYHMKIPLNFWDRILPVPHGEMKIVVIRPGLNARQCAQAFEDQEAITDSASKLAKWMVRFGIDRKIRPGQYRVNRTDAWNMARQLRATQPVTSSLTIIPGMDIFSLRGVFDEEQNPTPAKNGDLLQREILDDLNYPEPMRSRIPSTEAGRIAFLLPETYFVVEETPKDLVRAASHAWWDRYGVALPPEVTSKDLRQAATVASMVQREALWDDERAAIAGVIMNRLKKDMLLQIDATVIYAWKLRGRNLTRVLYSDLTVDSPYNTYVVQGLPPAPICVPSAESWAAALEPEENDYYYYVARKDGHHYFASTYEEHRRNTKKARTE
ncbi:MAG: endolytic transglycosylase MltG [Synergistaceae bacterium]|nr:endolytic transglycosylase MltG [Synergistaceae bacterium]